MTFPRRPPLSPARARQRDSAYQRLGITPAQVASAPRIDTLLSTIGGPAEAIRILRESPASDARQFLELWDMTSAAVRQSLPIEAFAIAAAIGVERLAGLLVETSMKLSTQQAAITLAREFPKVLEATIQFAKLPDGADDRRSLEKAVGLTPTPKGSQTTINVLQANAQQATVAAQRQELPSGDEIIRRLSDRMNAKMLNSQRAEAPVIEGEVLEDAPLALPQATSPDTLSPAEQIKRANAREAIPVVRTDWAANEVQRYASDDPEDDR